MGALLYRSTTTQMLSYSTPVTGSLDLGSLVMKSMFTDFYGLSGFSIISGFPYFFFVKCLFFWQLSHCLIKLVTWFFILLKWQLRWMVLIVFVIPPCPYSGGSWYFRIQSHIFSFKICSFLWATGNYSCWSSKTFMTAINSWKSVDNDPSSLIFRTFVSRGFFTM